MLLFSRLGSVIVTDFHPERVKRKPAREGDLPPLQTLLHRCSIMSLHSFRRLSCCSIPSSSLWPGQNAHVQDEEDNFYYFRTDWATNHGRAGWRSAPLRFFCFRANKGGASPRPIWVAKNKSRETQASGR